MRKIDFLLPIVIVSFLSACEWRFQEVPLSDMPLSDMPLSDMPLSDMPLSDMPLPTSIPADSCERVENHGRGFCALDCNMQKCTSIKKSKNKIVNTSAAEDSCQCIYNFGPTYQLGSLFASYVVDLDEHTDFKIGYKNQNGPPQSIYNFEVRKIGTTSYFVVLSVPDYRNVDTLIIDLPSKRNRPITFSEILITDYTHPESAPLFPPP